MVGNVTDTISVRMMSTALCFALTLSLCVESGVHAAADAVDFSSANHGVSRPIDGVARVSATAPPSGDVKIVRDRLIEQLQPPQDQVRSTHAMQHLVLL